MIEDYTRATELRNRDKELYDKIKHLFDTRNDDPTSSEDHFHIALDLVHGDRELITSCGRYWLAIENSEARETNAPAQCEISL